MKFYDREKEMETLRGIRKAESFLKATGKFAGYRLQYRALSLKNM